MFIYEYTIQRDLSKLQTRRSKDEEELTMALMFYTHLFNQASTHSVGCSLRPIGENLELCWHKCKKYKKRQRPQV